MTDKQQPEALRLAERISDVKCITESDARAVAAAADQLCLLHAELEILRAKLKVYEDLGDAGSDVQLLRMGYAAARLEIESLQSQLHAAKQINAAQFTLLAAAIPGAAMRPPHGQAPAQDANEHLDLLAQCRSAFPIPERGDPLEVHWAAAMADPGEVPGYLQEIAARHAAQAAPAAIQCVECNSCGSVFEIDTYMAGYTEGKGHCLNCHGIDSAPTTQPAQEGKS